MATHLNEAKQEHPKAKVVLWASLECTNFSKAKGGLSRDADSRTLANTLFRYEEVLNLDYIQIENVEEFLEWGPIIPKVGKTKEGYDCSFIQSKKGKVSAVMVPDPLQKGVYFKEWIKRMESYGYRWEYRILNSANYGAYTSRSRLFIQFAKYGLPIVWPSTTHSKDGIGLCKWMPVREVLDFTDEGRDIFDRPKPLAEKTLERIFAGLIKFVAGGKKEFLSKYFSGNPDSKNISVDSPAHSITTKDHHSLIQVEFLSAYYGTGDNVSSVDSPSPTITTKDRLALVHPRFIDMQYGNGTPTSINSPAATVTTFPKHRLITCRRWLLNPQYLNAGGSVDAPCFTLIARMDKAPPYLVCVETGKGIIVIYKTDSPFTVKIKEFMIRYRLRSVSMRMLRIVELKMIMGFPRNYVLVGNQQDQKRFIGNAVEVGQARAIAVATASAIKKLKYKLAEHAA